MHHFTPSEKWKIAFVFPSRKVAFSTANHRKVEFSTANHRKGVNLLPKGVNLLPKESICYQGRHSGHHGRHSGPQRGLFFLHHKKGLCTTKEGFVPPKRVVHVPGGWTENPDGVYDPCIGWCVCFVQCLWWVHRCRVPAPPMPYMLSPHCCHPRKCLTGLDCQRWLARVAGGVWVSGWWCISSQLAH